MLGWKRDVGRRLDALIVRNVPNVRKAVRWNSPSMAPRARLVPQLPLHHEVRQGGFLPRHVAASCPPIESKNKGMRYLHIHEDDQLDEELVASWIRQASELPAGPASAGELPTRLVAIHPDACHTFHLRWKNSLGL